MIASDARRLKVDDKVAIYCGTERKIGIVVLIDWPKFRISLIDSRGRTFHRVRTYRSIRYVEKFDRVPVEFLKPNELPSWLQFPVNEEYEIAADYCEDLGLTEASVVLRDIHCNPSQLRNLNSANLYRDKPNREQLVKALSALADFHDAQSKLILYVSRLDELIILPMQRS